MNTSIWEVIANTPWWVFAILVYLIRVGLLATRSRVVHIRRMLTVPLIFIGLSFVSLYNNPQLSNNQIAMWVGAFSIGSILGWLQFKALKIKAVKKTSSFLYVPGTWSLLTIILTMFAIRYYYGYENTIDPAIAQSKPWIFFAYGLFTGLFAGRIAYAIRCIKTGPYASDEMLASVRQ